MNVRPATVSVPVRELVAVFGDTLYATQPLPLPAAPLLMPSHDAPLDAVHAQPVAVVTLVVPLPPPAAMLAEVGEIVCAHAAPACVIVNVVPAIVSVPVRTDTLLLAATW